VLSGRRQTELDASLELCLAASSSSTKQDDFLTVAGDVSEEAAVKKLFEQAVGKFGRVDVVFNVSPATAGTVIADGGRAGGMRRAGTRADK
jgi:NAD(P)-dependent dehydrogenase (short-subunit alcohol dehydrogenase family)